MQLPLARAWVGDCVHRPSTFMQDLSLPAFEHSSTQSVSASCVCTFTCLLTLQSAPEHQELLTSCRRDSRFLLAQPENGLKASVSRSTATLGMLPASQWGALAKVRFR